MRTEELDFLMWLFIWFIVSWTVLVILFAASMNAREALKRGEHFHWSFRYPLLIGAGIGVVLDVLMNIPLGVFAFHEGPKWLEPMFSSRVQRHVDNKGRWHNRAVWWGRQLNKLGRNHIKRLP